MKAILNVMWAWAVVAVMVTWQGVKPVEGVRFELEAKPEGDPFGRRCLSFYIGNDILVTGNMKVSEGYQMRLDVEVRVG